MLTFFIGGLASCAIYALLAIGIVVIVRATGVVNFAQGEIAMVAAYAYLFAQEMGGSPGVQIAAAIGAGSSIALVFFFVTHTLLHRASHLAVVMGTIALSLLLQGVARLIFTDYRRRAEPWLVGNTDIQLGATAVTMNSILTISVATVLVVALGAWFRFTYYGRAAQAVAENRELASSSGINTTLMLGLSWIVGGVLASFTGVLFAPESGVFPGMAGHLVLASFTAALLGGFHSVAGAFLGGIVLGLLQTIAVVLIGGGLRDVVTFGVILVILLLRPKGLLRVARLREF